MDTTNIFKQLIWEKYHQFQFKCIVNISYILPTSPPIIFIEERPIESKSSQKPQNGRVEILEPWQNVSRIYKLPTFKYNQPPFGGNTFCLLAVSWISIGWVTPTIFFGVESNGNMSDNISLKGIFFFIFLTV